MPAAYISSRSTEVATMVMHDDEASAARRFAARATVNAALPVVPAKELAMAPSDHIGEFGCLGVFFSLAAAGAFIGYRAAASSATATGSSSARHGSQVLLAVVIGAGLLVAFCVLRLLVGFGRRSMITAGKPAAEAVWRRGWYCCRCVVVYFQGAEAPPGVAPGQPLTPAQFKRIVWSAGRFGRPT